jgi:tRNA pseudouridine38-40 synthase
LKKIILGIEYDGSNYHGWQRQENLNTIQGTLENALSQIAAEPIKVVCAGRTDVGVHALCQIVHFETNALRADSAWLFGGNDCLPSDIRIIWVKEAEPEFHARFSAIARHYRYYIYNNCVASAIWHKKVAFFPRKKLNVKAMQKAAKCLIGEHDFSAFRDSACQSLTPMRNVMKVKVLQSKKYAKIITIDVVANAFLQHMVRNIVGTLIMVGEGKKPVKWVKEVLRSRKRVLAGATADAAGLYLVDVVYQKKFKLLKNNNNKVNAVLIV